MYDARRYNARLEDVGVGLIIASWTSKPVSSDEASDTL